MPERKYYIPSIEINPERKPYEGYLGLLAIINRLDGRPNRPHTETVEEIVRRCRVFLDLCALVNSSPAFSTFLSKDLDEAIRELDAEEQEVLTLFCNFGQPQGIRSIPYVVRHMRERKPSYEVVKIIQKAAGKIGKDHPIYVFNDKFSLPQR